MNQYEIGQLQLPTSTFFDTMEFEKLIEMERKQRNFAHRTYVARVLLVHDVIP